MRAGAGAVSQRPGAGRLPAAKTERIGVATGIVWAFSRSPFIHAITALDIDEMSGGRSRLGIGAGVKRLNETWHDAEYGRPAPHLREARRPG